MDSDSEKSFDGDADSGNEFNNLVERRTTGRQKKSVKYNCNDESDSSEDDVKAMFSTGLKSKNLLVQSDSYNESDLIVEDIIKPIEPKKAKDKPAKSKVIVISDHEPTTKKNLPSKKQLQLLSEKLSNVKEQN